MTPVVAMNPARCTAREVRYGPRCAYLAVVALLSLLAVGCAGTDFQYSPGELSVAQRSRCRAVAEAYVESKDEYPSLRDGLKGDPVALAWFVRYLELQIVRLREGSVEVLGEQTVAAEDLRPDPKAPTPWNLPGQRADLRAMGQIVAIGAPAVDVVVHDLASSSQEFLRRIGFELLAGIGDPAVPPLLKLASGGDAQEQRVAARALGEIGAHGEALDALQELSRSPIWRVRSGVAQGLANGGPEARALLVKMLGDEDAFVRRMASQSLANYRDRTAASALVDYLEACKVAEDMPGELAAQKSLRIMAKAKSPRTVSAWRRFVRELPDEIESKEGGR